jgi:hypothetical protein
MAEVQRYKNLFRVELLLSLSSTTIDATRSKQLCDPNQSVKRHNIYSKA